MALAKGTTKAPTTTRLSRLNNMAFGLAAYVSRGGFPPDRARLASGCWSSSPGRAFTRRVPIKGFQLTSCVLASSSKLLGTIPISRHASVFTRPAMSRFHVLDPHVLVSALIHTASSGSRNTRFLPRPSSWPGRPWLRRRPPDSFRRIGNKPQENPQRLPATIDTRNCLA